MRVHVLVVSAGGRRQKGVHDRPVEERGGILVNVNVKSSSFELLKLTSLCSNWDTIAAAMPLPLSLPSSFHLAGKGGKNKKQNKKKERKISS